ncbi:TetR/AcrR family transcriptional regulator [Collinsella sp. TF09-1AT]|uniref:TetR/AcrR family transcriptional regulator n=1 Tax=Collinsella sp. TF09-1AT TaxID=2292334 RepID=UPI000E449781|nr:TetR/AcrR family transcriptional regulator [Collinsella sp. TF09-1AT]RGK83585.1 TetR/AcrR family transcriptional regulator [Collinsella sp. TF09-1AT]
MDARKAKSRAAIVAAFSELLCEEDYGKITVGDIIARAHVGRATFYGLFKSKDDLLSELVSDICTHALDDDGTPLDDDGTPLDDDGTPLDDPFVQVEHILSNLWERRQGVRALVAGAGSRVFADSLRKTIMSLAAETVPIDPTGPAGTMDRSFLLHHIASSFVATVQWWAWHNFQSNKADVAKDYLSAIQPLFS